MKKEYTQAQLEIIDFLDGDIATDDVINTSFDETRIKPSINPSTGADPYSTAR